MRNEEILKAVYDPANRANPYPLYAELRRAPVSWQKGGPSTEGTFAVATYREIALLLHDPRFSSDLRKGEKTRAFVPDDVPTFIGLDAPEHDRLRRLAMRHFGPPERPRYVDQLVPEIERVTRSLIDGLQGVRRFDVVARVAYELPVAVICRILGVPREDQPKFRVWTDAIVKLVGLKTPDAVAKLGAARAAMCTYMAELVLRRRQSPSDDMLSRMANDKDEGGRIADGQLTATAALLLVAGHETTVNLISNGILTLLRHPDVLERLRRTPELVIGAVEELLRYEPPVHMVFRTTLEDARVLGVTIPKGVLVTLVLAAGSRDPARFRDPDRFDPARTDNAHLGFGSGIHYCFGAPLARVEAQIALTELIQRLDRPRLVVDPPPYRDSPLLRGPRELLVEIDGIGATLERRP